MNRCKTLKCFERNYPRYEREMKKQIKSGKIKCSKCRMIMERIDKYNWVCKKCGIGMSVG